MSETDNNNVSQKKKKTKMIAPQAEATKMATATATKGTDAPANASTSSMMIAELPSYHKDKVNDHLTDVILDVENDEVTHGIQNLEISTKQQIRAEESLEERIEKAARSVASQLFEEWKRNCTANTTFPATHGTVHGSLTREEARMKRKDDVPSFILTKTWPKFSGTLHELQAWLAAIEMTFDALGVTEDQHRLLVPLHNLEGDARNWFLANLMTKNRFTTWTEFKVAISDRYQIFNQQEKLREDLEKLRQTSTVALYMQHFRNVYNGIENMSVEDAKFRFKRGLRFDVLAELSTLTSTNKVETLDQLMSLAAIAENTANNRKGATSHEGQPSNLGKRIATVRSKEEGKRSRGFTHLTPLEGLDLPACTNNQLRELGVCFNCLQRGHLRMACTNATVPRKSGTKPAAGLAQKKVPRH